MYPIVSLSPTLILTGYYYYCRHTAPLRTAPIGASVALSSRHLRHIEKSATVLTRPESQKAAPSIIPLSTPLPEKKVSTVRTERALRTTRLYYVLAPPAPTCIHYSEYLTTTNTHFGSQMHRSLFRNIHNDIPPPKEQAHNFPTDPFTHFCKTSLSIFQYTKEQGAVAQLGKEAKGFMRFSRIAMRKSKRQKQIPPQNHEENTAYPSPRCSAVVFDWDADDEFMSSGDNLPSRPLSLAIPAGPYCPRRPTLREVLANSAPPPWTLSAFMAYLSQNHCLETLEFTMDASRYRKHYETLRENSAGLLITPSTEGCEYVRMLWQKLLDAYITPNGPREVNLPSDVRDRLVSAPNHFTPPHPSQLDTAVRIVYDLMEESVLVPFLNSVSVARGPTTYSSPYASTDDMSSMLAHESRDNRSGASSQSGHGSSSRDTQPYSGPLRPSHPSHLALALKRGLGSAYTSSTTSSAEANDDSYTDDSMSTADSPTSTERRVRLEEDGLQMGPPQVPPLPHLRIQHEHLELPARPAPQPCAIQPEHIQLPARAPTAIGIADRAEILRPRRPAALAEDPRLRAATRGHDDGPLRGSPAPPIPGHLRDGHDGRRGRSGRVGDERSRRGREIGGAYTDSTYTDAAHGTDASGAADTETETETPDPSPDVAGAAARALRDLEIEETEIDWRLLSAAAAKRGRTPSVTSNETALMTPSMSITSLASTLVDRASVHSSTTVAGSHVTEADADRYGWEESLSARSSLDSGVSEETARSFRDLGGDATPRPTAEVQERTERGFMGKRGLLWKVLTMNARGM
ncbi:hypothetical protein V496_05008 [Pseudogymnoascus sp. VKM F-4515 (FW-2607)]|nr:hypothetical protein V496_05008 [Pseudogymnoascus sp. VKM F-4515 (FW-2607)]